jgi:hypothetical protein
MKTAVEWFVKEMFNQGYLNDGPLTVSNIEHFVQQAKEMEKEQIIEFADKYDAYIVQGGTLTAEQYYNETFKSE